MGVLHVLQHPQRPAPLLHDQRRCRSLAMRSAHPTARLLTLTEIAQAPERCRPSLSQPEAVRVHFDAIPPLPPGSLGGEDMTCVDRHEIGCEKGDARPSDHGIPSLPTRVARPPGGGRCGSGIPPFGMIAVQLRRTRSNIGHMRRCGLQDQQLRYLRLFGSMWRVIVTRPRCVCPTRTVRQSEGMWRVWLQMDESCQARPLSSTLACVRASAPDGGADLRKH